MAQYSGDHHALVFGASGILGWAIVDQILKGYPEPNVFKRVTALTNRPLARETTLWSESDKLEIVSGLDLNKGSLEDLKQEMRNKIPHVDTVTEVYFGAYIWDADAATECKINKEMLSRSVQAVEALASNLQYVVLPTGTKAYGMHLTGGAFPFSNQLPLREDLPRLPEPYGSRLFYSHQTDELQRLAKGKSWTWCDVRPDFVIGYVPNKNVYCISQILAVYLSLFAAVKGKGASVAFPGNDKSWRNQFSPSSQDITARFSIYASLNPSKVGGGHAYNVCDEDTATTWSKLWPVICSYFGLKGVGPEPNSSLPDDFMHDHQAEWQQLVKEHALRDVGAGKQGFYKMLMGDLDFDRPVDIGLSRRVGYHEKVENGGSWIVSFDRFRQGKVIP